MNRNKTEIKTFNMKKCYVIFVVGNFFPKINEINTYVTKCRHTYLYINC